MPDVITEKYKTRAAILKALAHPTRLFILDELAKVERCVLDLTDQVGADVSTVSKHLSVMKNAGLVVADKRGLQVYYRLAAPCVLGFFDCLENVMESNLQRHLHVMK